MLCGVDIVGIGEPENSALLDRIAAATGADPAGILVNARCARLRADPDRDGRSCGQQLFPDATPWDWEQGWTASGALPASLPPAAPPPRPARTLELADQLDARLDRPLRRVRPQDHRHRPGLRDQVGHGVARVELPAALGVVLGARQIAEASRSCSRARRCRRSGERALISSPVSKNISMFIAAITMSLMRIAWMWRSQVGCPCLDRVDQLPRPVLVLLRRRGSPTPARRRRAAPRAVLLPVREDRSRLVERRQLDVVERDRGLGRGEVGAGVAV